MRHSILFIASLLGLAITAAYPAEYKAGSLSITDPWSPATPKGATVAAGYMKITNTGTVSDRLIGGSSDIAPKLQVHEAKMENGVMKMRPVTGGVEIKPGQTVELKPESLHVMFVGLKKPLTAGDHVKAELMFEKAGSVNIEYDVLAMGARPSREMPGMKMPGH